MKPTPIGRQARGRRTVAGGVGNPQGLGEKGVPRLAVDAARDRGCARARAGSVATLHGLARFIAHVIL